MTWRKSGCGAWVADFVNVKAIVNSCLYGFYYHVFEVESGSETANRSSFAFDERLEIVIPSG